MWNPRAIMYWLDLLMHVNARGMHMIVLLETCIPYANKSNQEYLVQIMHFYFVSHKISDASYPSTKVQIQTIQYQNRILNFQEYLYFVKQTGTFLYNANIRYLYIPLYNNYFITWYHILPLWDKPNMCSIINKRNSVVVAVQLRILSAWYQGTR